MRRVTRRSSIDHQAASRFAAAAAAAAVLVSFAAVFLASHAQAASTIDSSLGWLFLPHTHAHTASAVCGIQSVGRSSMTNGISTPNECAALRMDGHVRPPYLY